jgi:hypothetical protein
LSREHIGGSEKILRALLMNFVPVGSDPNPCLPAGSSVIRELSTFSEM